MASITQDMRFRLSLINYGFYRHTLYFASNTFPSLYSIFRNKYFISSIFIPYHTRYNNLLHLHSPKNHHNYYNKSLPHPNSY